MLHCLYSYLSVTIKIKYYLAWDSGFKIQDSGFKIQKEKYENAFQKKYHILETQSMCP